MRGGRRIGRAAVRQARSHAAPAGGCGGGGVASSLGCGIAWPHVLAWISEVIALTSVATNLAAIVGGIVVFHEPIGSGALATTGRCLAFCVAIAGAALMPTPMRTTPDTA